MAKQLHFKPSLQLQAKHNAKLTKSPFRNGDIVYYYKDVKTAVADPMQSGKFTVRYTGPFIITKLHSNNTCELRNITTGKFLTQRVNTDKLKRPSYYRLVEGSTQHKNAMDALSKPYYTNRSNVSIDDTLHGENTDFLNPRFGEYDPEPFVKVQ